MDRIAVLQFTENAMLYMFYIKMVHSCLTFSPNERKKFFWTECIFHYYYYYHQHPWFVVVANTYFFASFLPFFSLLFLVISCALWKNIAHIYKRVIQFPFCFVILYTCFFFSAYRIRYESLRFRIYRSLSLKMAESTKSCNCSSFTRLKNSTVGLLFVILIQKKNCLILLLFHRRCRHCCFFFVLAL